MDFKTTFGSLDLVAPNGIEARFFTLPTNVPVTDGVFRVNGVRLAGALDFQLLDGKWVPKRTPTHYGHHDRDACSLKRMDNYNQCSESARTKVLFEVAISLNAFYSTDEGKRYFVQAEVANCERALDRAIEFEAEANKAYIVAREARRVAFIRLTAARTKEETNL